MTWKELAEAILKLPDVEQQKPANVFMRQTGECALVSELDKISDWREGDEPDPHTYTIIYER